MTKRLRSGFSRPSGSTIFRSQGHAIRTETIPPEVTEARDDLIKFAEWMRPDYMAEAAHKLIGEKLNKVMRREIPKLMIYAPPQLGKSYLTSQFFPAFWLGNRPNEPVILTSYGAKLANHFSGRARSIVESDKFNELFPEITTLGDSRAKDLWNLRGYRGYLNAAGVGGPISGWGAALAIIDDPVKNFEDAYSPTSRMKKWEWYRTTLTARLWKNAAILLIMTRWHVNDLAGMILEEEDDWEILRIPALGESQAVRDERNERLGLGKGLPDPLGREEGESAIPIRFPKENYEERKEIVGPSAWSSEYQGSPVPAEGNLVKRESFEIRDVPPAPQHMEIVRYWDKAATAGGGDKTVGVLMGKDLRERPEFTYWVLHVVSGQWGTKMRDHVIKTTAATDAEKWGPTVKVRFEVEGGSSGVDVKIDTIRMLEGYDVEGDGPSGSKEVRFIPFARQVEAGNVALLQGEWTQEYLDYIVLFPQSGKDEADATSGAFNTFLKEKKKKAKARSRS